MTKVKVTANAEGQVVVVSQNNPDFGYVRLEQVTRELDERGWLRKVVKSALIKGKVSELKELGYRAGQELEGQIVIRESLTPTNPKDLTQDIKIAGNTNIPCLCDDQPIYRTSFYTTNMELKDELLAHTNGTQIREALNAIAEKQEAEASDTELA